MTNFYIYGIFKDSDSIPFYIGKGSGDRIKRTLKQGSLLKLNIIKKYNAKAKILINNLYEEDAFKLEKCLIRLFGKRDDGGVLINHTDGGEGRSGCIPWNKNMKMSKEFCKKLSKSFKGRIVSDITKEKHRKIMIGDGNPAKRLEVRRKISKNNKGVPKSEEHKNNISVSLCKKTYKFISPCGKIFITNNYSKFCREHNINKGNLGQVLSGKRTHVQNWMGTII